MFQQFKKRINENEWQLLNKTHPKLIETIENIKEDDNPIILQIKLKN